MRNISFQLTLTAFRNRSKTVTRRLGWKTLSVGQALRAVEKCQGLRPGEQIQELGFIVVEEIRVEPLHAIDQADVVAEGFPNMTPEGFVRMFQDHMKCNEDEPVTRMQFRYITTTEAHTIDATRRAKRVRKPVVRHRAKAKTNTRGA